MNFEFFSWKKKMSENVGKLQVFAIREREKIKKKAFYLPKMGIYTYFIVKSFWLSKIVKRIKIAV